MTNVHDKIRTPVTKSGFVAQTLLSVSHSREAAYCLHRQVERRAQSVPRGNSLILNLDKL